MWNRLESAPERYRRQTSSSWHIANRLYRRLANNCNFALLTFHLHKLDNRGTCLRPLGPTHLCFALLCSKIPASVTDSGTVTVSTQHSHVEMHYGYLVNKWVNSEMKCILVKKFIVECLTIRNSHNG